MNELGFSFTSTAVILGTYQSIICFIQSHNIDYSINKNWTGTSPDILTKFVFIVSSCTQFYFTACLFFDAYDNTSMVFSPLVVLRSLAIFTVLLMIRIWRVHKYCDTFYKYRVWFKLRYELMYYDCWYIRYI